MGLCCIGKLILESKYNYCNYIIINKYTVRNVNVKLTLVSPIEMCHIVAYIRMLVT